MAETSVCGSQRLQKRGPTAGAFRGYAGSKLTEGPSTLQRRAAQGRSVAGVFALRWGNGEERVEYGFLPSHGMKEQPARRTRIVIGDCRVLPVSKISSIPTENLQ